MSSHIENVSRAAMLAVLEQATAWGKAPGRVEEKPASLLCPDPVTLEDELVDLLASGVVADRSEKPYSPVVTVVGTQRADDEVLGLVEDFMYELMKRYPKARLVVGDSSTIEKYAVELADQLGMPYEVVEKAKRGEWDEGALIRDERVVAKASNVVVFDSSSRSKTYKQLSERQMKKFSSLAGKATKPKENHEDNAVLGAG